MSFTIQIRQMSYRSKDSSGHEHASNGQFTSVGASGKAAKATEESVKAKGKSKKVAHEEAAKAHKEAESFHREEANKAQLVANSTKNAYIGDKSKKEAQDKADHHTYLANNHKAAAADHESVASGVTKQLRPNTVTFATTGR